MINFLVFNGVEYCNSPRLHHYHHAIDTRYFLI
jgi:hypothetical protein